jgi:ABC-2 type transport system permease protein
MVTIARKFVRALGLCWHYGLQKQKVDMAYRGDFAAYVGVGVLYSVIQLFFLWALLRQIPDIAGWDFPQVVLIYGFGQLSFGYFSIFFFDLAVRFSDFYIIEGNLDRPLLRQLSPLFQLVMENLNFRDIIVVIKGWAIIIWALANLEPPVALTPWAFIMANLLAALGAVVYAGVFLAVASLSYWVKDRVGFTSPLFSISEASRYPLTIYNPAVQVFFSLVIPFCYCAFYPATYFTDPAAWGHWLVLAPFVAAGTFTVGTLVFYRGLRTYESTGS